MSEPAGKCTTLREQKLPRILLWELRALNGFEHALVTFSTNPYSFPTRNVYPNTHTNHTQIMHKHLKTHTNNTHCCVDLAVRPFVGEAFQTRRLEVGAVVCGQPTDCLDWRFAHSFATLTVRSGMYELTRRTLLAHTPRFCFGLSPHTPLCRFDWFAQTPQQLPCLAPLVWGMIFPHTQK